jgi:hypothetical protein
MAVGQSDDIDPDVAIREAIDECRAQLDGGSPQAALLFVAYELFVPSLPAAVRAAFPGVQLVGATSAAQMSSSSGYTEDGLTLAVLSSDDVEFNAAAVAHLEADVDARSREAIEQALNASDQPPRLCIMVADGFAAPAALEVVKRALPNDVFVVGGAASGPPPTTVRPNFVIANDDVVEDGLAVLLLSGNVDVSVAVGTGFRAVGPRGTVTAADEGHLIAIDGKPALAFIKPYVDVPGPATFGNPLRFREPSDEEWYLRGMFSADPETGVIDIQGTVSVGAEVQLTISTTDEVVTATKDVTQQAADGYPTGSSPSAALIFSCAVRRYMLGSKTAQEVSHARALLPSTLPLAGMYCFGEIAPAGSGSQSRFHNETFVALLLG